MVLFMFYHVCNFEGQKKFLKDFTKVKNIATLGEMGPFLSSANRRQHNPCPHKATVKLAYVMISNENTNEDCNAFLLSNIYKLTPCLCTLCAKIWAFN